MIKNSTLFSFSRSYYDGGSSEFSDSKRANWTICIRVTRTVSVRDRVTCISESNARFVRGKRVAPLIAATSGWMSKQKARKLVHVVGIRNGGLLRRLGRGKCFCRACSMNYCDFFMEFQLGEWSTCFSPSYARWNPSRLSIWNRAINDTCIK